MINLNHAKSAFRNYLREYDISHQGIALKIAHTYRVMGFSELIANSIGLNQIEVELAILIALLHDIGRFEQIKKFGTFDDSKFDHADYGVHYLFKETHIRDFIKDSSYDEIIKKAVANHSLYIINDNLNEQEKLHTKILRDADKLDIFRVKISGNLELMYSDLNHVESQVISDKVYKCICEHISINRSICQSTLDSWLMTIGFVFDLNFLYSFKFIFENRYIEKLLNYFEFTNKENSEKIKRIQKEAKNYIEGKLQI